jgi:hypothetical protein
MATTTMVNIKRNFGTAVEVKQRYDAVQFMLGLLEKQITEILGSPDFVNLPKEEREQMIVARARAIKYWTIQLNDFMDQNLGAWMNTAGRVRSKELDITFEQAVNIYGDSMIFKQKILEEHATPDEDEEVDVEEEWPEKDIVGIASSETPVKAKKETEEKSDEPSDDDILAQLMAGQ